MMVEYSAAYDGNESDDFHELMYFFNLVAKEISISKVGQPKPWDEKVKQKSMLRMRQKCKAAKLD